MHKLSDRPAAVPINQTMAQLQPLCQQNHNKIHYKGNSNIVCCNHKKSHKRTSTTAAKEITRNTAWDRRKSLDWQLQQEQKEHSTDAGFEYIVLLKGNEVVLKICTIFITYSPQKTAREISGKNPSVSFPKKAFPLHWGFFRTFAIAHWWIVIRPR